MSGREASSVFSARSPAPMKRKFCGSVACALEARRANRNRIRVIRVSGTKKNAAQSAAFSQSNIYSSYFEIERRNIRSIFSLVASQQDCEACAAASAWLAALWAPLAVDEAD